MSRNAKPLNQPERCQGKLIFLSFERASKAAARTRRAKGREDEHYGAYHCTRCQGFHVGSSFIEPHGKVRLKAIR